ncbi:rho GTPase-activating protein 19 isoform X2 [Coccinella septempunctata]|uniref:rho GTPase-activating protein 19 isoform X2 n=1 Tax=Coccinella septempunctata TaxID=41139 RepID=UPI001D08354F|nr:rho GTPase-activating protein 19 isoform X2 [Coccinella septempunctata]
MNILKLADEDLAEKFRQEFSEQYNILVRMHLSFVLDLNTEENEYLNEKSKNKKWKLVSFMKKSKSTDTLEGFPLTQEGISQVYQLIEYLKKEQNLKIEGIFRRTGSLNRQNELKTLLCQGVTIDLECGNFSVHDCASVLKVFLSELPEPLLTECHFPAYCQIAELCGIIEKPTQEEKLLEALQLILLLLPSENRVLLKDILDLLHLTASYEYANKMSPDNLATLFTPHLLCPRKLSAEQLHANSQNLSGIIAFMITHCNEIFKIPQKLIVDFRVRFEKRILQPKMCMNESVTDQHAANTVFTFIDRELTAKENESNSTETAIAQLYAHIQSLPESSKKRKLVKQFNKENGHGTPLQVLRSSAPKSKSIGDSIKKHILNKKLMRTIKKQSLSQMRSSSEEVLNSPAQAYHRSSSLDPLCDDY